MIPCDMTFVADFNRCLPAEQWQMAIQVLEDLASQDKEIDLITYTSAIQAMFSAEQWRAAFKTFSQLQLLQVRAVKSSAKFRAKTAVQALRSHHLWNDALTLGPDLSYFHFGTLEQSCFTCFGCFGFEHK
eukprot:s3132_g1.t5